MRAQKQRRLRRRARPKNHHHGTRSYEQALGTTAYSRLRTVKPASRRRMLWVTHTSLVVGINPLFPSLSCCVTSACYRSRSCGVAICLHIRCACCILLQFVDFRVFRCELLRALFYATKNKAVGHNGLGLRRSDCDRSGEFIIVVVAAKRPEI